MTIFSIINQLIPHINNYGIKVRLLKINIVTRVGKLNICIYVSNLQILHLEWLCNIICMGKLVLVHKNLGCVYFKIETPLPTTKLSWEKKGLMLH